MKIRELKILELAVGPERRRTGGLDAVRCAAVRRESGLMDDLLTGRVRVPEKVKEEAR